MQSNGYTVSVVLWKDRSLPQPLAIYGMCLYMSLIFCLVGLPRTKNAAQYHKCWVLTLLSFIAHIEGRKCRVASSGVARI